MARQAKMSKEGWQRVAAERVAAAQAVLETEVTALRSGEDWRSYLEFSAKLHAYSPNNIMLLHVQHAKAFEEGRVDTPSPTFIAGYRTWQALGRQVDKGQKGYAILAPVRYKRREAVDATGTARRLARGETPAPEETEHSRQVLGGFTVEHVFAAEQTSGDRLPDAPTPKLLEGEAPAGLGEAVMALVEARGFSVDPAVDARELNGANGVTRWDLKQVQVRSDMDDAAMVKTLIHEAAHVLLHEDPPGSLISRDRKEVEAESVAFVVAAAHGMPTDGYSFPYVAGWAGDDPAKAIAQTQASVSKTAKAILEASPALIVSGGRVPGADQAVEAARQQRDAGRRAAQTRQLIDSNPRVQLVKIGFASTGGPGMGMAS
ncbi:MAG: ArdC-like ssDNA-binding domain-containing protein [Actinomycetota bacterium]|nr:ArdC-like ssDNA-binding domain-containing protein [Actinomycetota bacterium]